MSRSRGVILGRGGLFGVVSPVPRDRFLSGETVELDFCNFLNILRAVDCSSYLVFPRCPSSRGWSATVISGRPPPAVFPMPAPKEVSDFIA